MRTLALFLASLLFLLPAHAAAGEPVRLELAQTEPFPLTRAALPNGLRVWIQPQPGSESVAALLVLRVGARDETPAEGGVSHFVEHMVFTGTERWTETEIKEVIDKRGGRWNGWTGAETTTYFAHVAAGDLDVALDWLSQVVFHPTFPADKVDKEREVIFEEKWGRYGWLVNTLDRLGFGYELGRAVNLALFPGSGLGQRVVGEDTSLESLDRDSLLAHYRAYYTPRNAVLVVAGNVTPEQALASAGAALGHVEPGDAPAPRQAPPLPSGGPYHLVVRGPWVTDQVTLMVGARTVGRAHPDRWALEVLSEMLSKELMEEIRYKQGLVYGISAYNSAYSDAGFFAVSSESQRRRVEAIRRAVEERLEQVGAGQVDAGAVADAKAALAGSWALAMEDNVERAGWLASWAFVLAPDEPVPNYPAAVDAVSPGDLTRVVQTYFTPERRFVGLHDPILTVASATRLAAGVVLLALAGWGSFRLRRGRARRRDARQPPAGTPAG